MGRNKKQEKKERKKGGRREEKNNMDYKKENETQRYAIYHRWCIQM